MVSSQEFSDALAALGVVSAQQLSDEISSHAAQISSVHGAAADEKLSVEAIVVDPPPAVFTSVAGYGHSYMAGTSLSPADRAINKIAETLGLGSAMTNLGVNSVCISATNTTPANGIQNYGTSLWMMRTFRPSLGGLIDAADRTGLHVLLNGLNDLAALGAPNATEITMTVRAMETWFARLLANDFFEDNHATHTFGTGWAQNTGTTYGSGSTNRGTVVVPGIITILTPSTFPGGDIFVQFIQPGGNPARGGTHTMYLDTVEHGTFSTVNDTSGRNTHSVYWFNNCPAGERYIQIVTNTVTHSLYYDGWGFIADTSDAVGVAVKQPRLTAAGLTQHSNQYTNANIDSFNDAIDAMAARFSTGRILVADPGPAMDEDPDMFRTAEGDSLHPNAAGNTAIHDAVIAVV